MGIGASFSIGSVDFSLFAYCILAVEGRELVMVSCWLRENCDNGTLDAVSCRIT